MPLALSALALAAPSQLQERAGTDYTDTVELYPLIYVHIELTMAIVRRPQN